MDRLGFVYFSGDTIYYTWEDAGMDCWKYTVPRIETNQAGANETQLGLVNQPSSSSSTLY